MNVPMNQMPDHARVWIYQHNDVIPSEKRPLVEEALNAFVTQWSAHGQPLAAHAMIQHDRFIILMVDEGLNNASGCSIDASVHFIRSLESNFGLQLFDRMVFSYQKEGKVYTVSKREFAEAFAKGDIDEQTLVFDNLVKTKQELESSWLKPLGDSWHRRFVKAVVGS